MPKVKRVESEDDDSSSSAESEGSPPPPPPKKKGKTEKDKDDKEKAEKEKAKPKKDESSSDSGPDDVEPPSKGKSSSSKGPAENTWVLERNRMVKINEFRGRVHIDIREYYEKDGQLLPGKKGISLNANEWKKLKASIPEIDGALKKF